MGTVARNDSVALRQMIRRKDEIAMRADERERRRRLLAVCMLIGAFVMIALVLSGALQVDEPRAPVVLATE